MVAFTVYDPTTGRVLRSGGCSSAIDAVAQAGEGEAVILGKVHEEDELVVGGRIVPAPARPVVPRPTRDPQVRAMERVWDRAPLLLLEGGLERLNAEIETVRGIRT